MKIRNIYQQWYGFSAVGNNGKESLQDSSKGRTSHRGTWHLCSYSLITASSPMPTTVLQTQNASLQPHPRCQTCISSPCRSALWAQSNPAMGLSAPAVLPASLALFLKTIQTGFIRYGGNLIFFLIFRNSCIIKHSYSWFTCAMQSTAKITTFIWSAEHCSNYVKM